MKDYLDAAIDAVTDACRICRRIQGHLVKQDRLIKDDRSPVTIADYASQAIVCRKLKAAFPNVGIVGEENAGKLRQKEHRDLLERIAFFLPEWPEEEILESIDLGNNRADALFFALDPIDGTKGFLRGEQYAVALALVRNGNVEMGVLGCPNLPLNGSGPGILMHAIRGQGAFRRGLEDDQSRRTQVSDTDSSGVIRFLESVESGHANHERHRQVMKAFGDRGQSVRADSQAKYALLALGEADVYLRLPKQTSPRYQEKIWDHAAGMVIVEEAGGIVTDIHGKRLDFGLGRTLSSTSGVIATNGKLHPAILEQTAGFAWD